MQSTFVKAIAAALWMSAVPAAGLVAGAGSMSSWLLLALVPPVVLFGRFSSPSQTMSESIHEVLK
jgi:hypothetical protein